MSQQTLTLVEATGIQEYIFGSNQLAQNIGASELVQQATTDWVCAALPPPHNVVGTEIADRSLEADGLAAEVVYAGGGNAMILFAGEEQALEFAGRLSRTILEQAPGLQVVLKRRPFDPQCDVLARLHQELRAELAQRKLDRPRSVPLQGLGVTAACVFTGAPAVEVREQQLISAEVRAKLDARIAGQTRLEKALADVKRYGYEFIYDFDLLGTKGESSYLAVIHTDGNAMGERIQRIGDKHATPEDNSRYARALRAFSRSVQEAAEAALQKTAGLLLDPNNLKDGKLGGVVPIPERGGTEYLPFRPIVFGGDDVTFVCEGRLGLAVAVNYLDEFSARPLSDGRPAHARAGVAVVKSHYPFSRAYELAEALCASAKDYIRGCKDGRDPGLTALDWHFAVGGLVLPLPEVRRREYTVPAGSLLMRPLRLSHPEGDWRSWRTFREVMHEFQSPGGDWADRRNKVKALRDALRAGPDAVKLFVQAHGALPSVAQWPDMKDQGWQGPYCGYFDAIEALDFYVPLEGGLSA